jgi:hypothetical protein
LVDPDGNRIRIDVEIAPLIRRLWELGFDTCNSCQDNFGYVWVQFDSASHTEGFLTSIRRGGDAELGHRACNPYPVSPHDRAKLATDYHAWEDSWLIAADTNAPDDDQDLLISIGIRFPREHLARVIGALG